MKISRRLLMELIHMNSAVSSQLESSRTMPTFVRVRRMYLLHMAIERTAEGELRWTFLTLKGTLILMDALDLCRK